jgi:hypothetical protein
MLGAPHDALECFLEACHRNGLRVNRLSEIREQLPEWLRAIPSHRRPPARLVLALLRAHAG